MERHTYFGEVQRGYGQEPLFLTREQRLEHIGVLGASGVGKSTLLKAIAEQDIARGSGILYIDPHGDDAEAILDRIPSWRHNHVCYLHLADAAYSIPLNVLECDHPDDRAFVADAVVSALRDIWFENMTAAPRMENVLRHAILALLHFPGATLPLVSRLLTDDAYRRTVIPHVAAPVTRHFFEDRFEEWREAFRAEIIEPVLTRLDTVLSFPSLLNTLAQHRRTLRLDRAMQAGRVVIANLSSMGETAAQLMGALLLARVRAAALARARFPREERVDFHVIVDEVQRFSTNSFPSLLAEARKFNVSLTYSSQMAASLSERTRAALFGTTGTIVAFRVGPEDADAISPKFARLHQTFNHAALHELDRGEAFVKVGAHDAHRIRFAASSSSLGSSSIVRHQSRRHYARPREAVEKWVARTFAK